VNGPNRIQSTPAWERATEALVMLLAMHGGLADAVLGVASGQPIQVLRKPHRATGWPP
jgi:hypothetical protein